MSPWPCTSECRAGDPRGQLAPRFSHIGKETRDSHLLGIACEGYIPTANQTVLPQYGWQLGYAWLG